MDTDDLEMACELVYTLSCYKGKHTFKTIIVLYYINAYCKYYRPGGKFEYIQNRKMTISNHISTHPALVVTEIKKTPTHSFQIFLLVF